MAYTELSECWNSNCEICRWPCTTG